MDLASVVAALASVGVRVSGSAPNSSVQVDSSRACPPGLAGPEPSGTINDLGQHFQPPACSTPAPPPRPYPFPWGLPHPSAPSVPVSHPILVALCAVCGGGGICELDCGPARGLAWPFVSYAP